MEGVSPPQSLWKVSCATFIETDSVLLEVRNRKEGCCPWSLVATTSHILTLKLNASLRLMIKSFFLVLNTRLTSLNSACISFTSNQVHSLLRIYHRAMLVHLRASILHSDGPLLSHVVSISPVTSKTILFYLSKGMSLLITPNIHFYWRLLLLKKAITAQLWNLKVLFFLWHSIKSLD
jgi:hypothetical protein